MPAMAWKLSVIIPCYNEELTLARCVDRVRAIQDADLKLEIIVVDDCSRDRSPAVAQDLARQFPEIRYLRHERNRGKGAALHTGFKHATGDFVAVQDADLEYDPRDLKKLLEPLIDGRADVVLGSRFLTGGSHRVLYFWHSIGNHFLTLMSNMLTDLNLTDMETCYKVFRRDVIQHLDLKEERFGFEPEVVAKMAHMRLRIYEIGISYYGRTYAEGKKIGMRDGWRALYCVLKYNLPKVPWPIQFMFYVVIGGFCGLLNLAFFLGLYHSGLSLTTSVAVAYVAAAVVNYLLSIALLFRHRARWNSVGEILMFALVVSAVGVLDVLTTQLLVLSGFPAGWAKALSSVVGLALNYAGRRRLVFFEPSSTDWKPQENQSHAAQDLKAEAAEGLRNPSR